MSNESGPMMMMMRAKGDVEVVYLHYIVDNLERTKGKKKKKRRRTSPLRTMIGRY